MNVKGIKEAAARVPAAIIMATVLAVTLFGGTAPATATPTTAAASAATAAAPAIAEEAPTYTVKASAALGKKCRATGWKSGRKMVVCVLYDSKYVYSRVTIKKNDKAKHVKGANLVFATQHKKPNGEWFNGTPQYGVGVKWAMNNKKKFFNHGTQPVEYDGYSRVAASLRFKDRRGIHYLVERSPKVKPSQVAASAPLGQANLALAS